MRKLAFPTTFQSSARRRGILLVGGRCCTVDIVTRLWHGQSSFRIPPEAKCLSSEEKLPDRLSSPSSLLFKRNRGIRPGINRPEREIKHTPPSKIEFKTDPNSNSTSPVLLYGMDRDNVINACHSGKQRRFIEQVNSKKG